MRVSKDGDGPDVWPWFETPRFRAAPHHEAERESPNGALTPAAGLPDLWMNPYFLNSLKRLGMQIEGV